MTHLSGETYTVGIYTDIWALEDTEVLVDVTSEPYEREPYSWGESRGSETEYTAEIVAVRFPAAWVAADLACQVLGKDAIGEAERRLTDAINEGAAEPGKYLQRAPCMTAVHDQLEGVA